MKVTHGAIADQLAYALNQLLEGYEYEEAWKLLEAFGYTKDGEWIYDDEE